MSETLHMCCYIAMHRIEIERVVGRGWGVEGGTTERVTAASAVGAKRPRDYEVGL